MSIRKDARTFSIIPQIASLSLDLFREKMPLMASSNAGPGRASFFPEPEPEPKARTSDASLKKARTVGEASEKQS